MCVPAAQGSNAHDHSARKDAHHGPHTRAHAHTHKGAMKAGTSAEFVFSCQMPIAYIRKGCSHISLNPSTTTRRYLPHDPSGVLCDPVDCGILPRSAFVCSLDVLMAWHVRSNEQFFLLTATARPSPTYRQPEPRNVYGVQRRAVPIQRWEGKICWCNNVRRWIHNGWLGFEKVQCARSSVSL